jgi:predicted dehydrogenase
MVGAILRGGGELAAAYGAEPDKAAAFAKAFPQAKMVESEEEILNDRSTQLILSSTIPNQRGPVGRQSDEARQGFPE